MSSSPLPEMQPTNPDSRTSESVATTAGQILRQARQAKGVDLSMLAVTLKVPVQLLEALEADRYASFKGGPTFLRGIASSMCRHLGLDSSPVLALLPSPVSTMAGVRPSLKSSSGMQHPTLRPNRGRPLGVRTVLSLSILMLLGIASFLWLPSPDEWWPGNRGTESSAFGADESAVPMGQASNPESTEEALDPASSALPMASAQLSASSAAASASPNSITFPTVSLLRVEAIADTWVEVRGGKAPAVSQRMKAGEHLEVKQPGPYSVTIGPAAAVNVTWRSLPFELKPHTIQNVARFEVKE